jgi:hypothetical protein
MPVTNSEPSRSPHPDCDCLVRASSVRSDFYREELRKHWHCLDQQRESYSHKTMTDVDAALRKLMENVDRLCACEHGGEVVSRLLRQIDGVTRLSASSGRQPPH